jgi:hypothetical protein
MQLVVILAALTLMSMGCASPNPSSAPPRIGSDASASAEILASADPALNPRIVRLRNYCTPFSTNAVEYEEEPTFSSGYLFEVIAPGSQKGKLLHFHDCSAPWERSLFARVGHVYLLHVATRQHSGSVDYPLRDVATNEVQHLCTFGWRVREIQ